MNNKKPSVSILVPIYKVEKYIERCARSLFEQSYDNIEYIFVDDCSPDLSVSILKKIIDEYPKRKPHVKIIRHSTNKGLASARNTAVENCITDFLIHVDSDDFIDLSLVDKCIKKQMENKCDIVLFDFWILYKDRRKRINHIRCSGIKERTIALLSRKTPVCVWSALYNSNLYKKYGIKAIEGVNNNEDYQVTPKLTYYSQSIDYLNIPLYYYDCTNEGSITHYFSEEKAEEGFRSIKILKDFFKDKGDDYIEAIKFAEINRYVTYIMNGILSNNKLYVYKLRNKFLASNLKNINLVPLSTRVYLLCDNYYFLYLYTRIGKIIKNILTHLYNERN